MRKKTRITLSLLVLVVLLTSNIVVYANNDTVIAERVTTPISLPENHVVFNEFPDITGYSTYDENTASFQFIQAEEKSPADRNDVAPLASTVAKMKICAVATGSSSGGGTVGHAFLIITNTSNSNITIGGLSGIAPNKSVTVGTWGNISEHKGVWYNYEGLTATNNDAYNNNVAMQVSLTSSQLSVVNTNIKNRDSYSTLNNNCTHFAAGVWNSVCSDRVSSGSPNVTVDSIKSYSTKYFTNAAIPFHYLVYYGQPPQKSAYYN